MNQHIRRQGLASLNTGHVLKTFISVFLLLFLLAFSKLVWPQSSAAQNSMPAWTVLVLKLVSSTHVQPTTGIVLSDEGLIVVPLEFARSGDEIMVLDGGTDIVRNGRPAVVLHTLPGDHLAILQVQGLRRPAAKLSSLPDSSIESLQLIAFPPAEMMARGAAPVRTPVKALSAITSSHPTLEALPNVTGALADACGNLVAINQAVDVQSMSPASNTRIAWQDGWKRAADAAGVSVQSAECNPAPASEPLPADASKNNQEAEPEVPSEQVPEPNPEVLAEPEPEPESDQESASEQELLKAEDEAVAKEDEPIDDKAGLMELNEEMTALDIAQDGGEDSLIDGDLQDESAENFSWPVLIGIGLLVLLGVAWLLNRYQAGKQGSAANKANSTGGILSNEPRTVEYDDLSVASPSPLLLLEGELENGQPFHQELALTGPDWHADIGRQGADVTLPSPAISRSHARLAIQKGRLTLTDLGSTNGTQLNGVPCLPGEVFLLQTGDRVKLGDIELQLGLSAGKT